MIDTATISGIILASAGVLILGQAGLIKGMIQSKMKEDREAIQNSLNDIKVTQEKLLESFVQLQDDIHDLDLRLTKLETEHRFHSCIYSRDTEP